MDKNIIPTISVIMPIYNSSKYLWEAINSVLVQTFKDFELIIINDNLVENKKEINESLKIIKSFKDDRVKLLDNKGNIGVSASVNKALGIAQGKYIAKMDSDDINNPTRLRKQFEFLEKHKNYTLVGTLYENVDEEGKFISRNRFPTKNFQLKMDMFNRNPFAGGVVMFRAETLKKSGIFEFHDNDFSEDYDLWFRLAKYGKVYNIPEYLYKYRVYFNNITNKDKIEKQVGARKRLVLRYRYDKNFIFYYFCNSINIFVRKYLKKGKDYIFKNQGNDKK